MEVVEVSDELNLTETKDDIWPDILQCILTL